MNQVLPRLKVALLRGDRISTLDGFNRFGTLRLSEYIRRLRAKGMKIVTEMMYDYRSNKYYGVYYLKK